MYVCIRPLCIHVYDMCVCGSPVNLPLWVLTEIDWSRLDSAWIRTFLEPSQIICCDWHAHRETDVYKNNSDKQTRWIVTNPKVRETNSSAEGVSGCQTEMDGPLWQTCCCSRWGSMLRGSWRCIHTDTLQQTLLWKMTHRNTKAFCTDKWKQTLTAALTAEVQ